MGLIRKRTALVLCTYVLLCLPIYSQSYECDIQAPESPEMIRASRHAGNVTQDVNILGTSEWTNTENFSHSDDEHMSVYLDRYDRAHRLHFTNFNFQVPNLATINGLRISVEGKSAGEGEVSDMQLQFTIAGEGPVGQDKSNYPLIGTEWFQDSLGTDAIWKFGYAGSEWERTWTPSEINSDQFGFVLWIENQTDHAVEAFIDQVEITVFYTPVYDLCIHDCTVFFIDEVPGVTEYNWTLPNIFEPIWSEVNQHISNVTIIDSIQGSYEVCVTPLGYETCCRSFIMGNCNRSSLSGTIWKDTNLDGIRDTNEQTLSGVTVRLYNESGDRLQTLITSNNGSYIFNDLIPGNYRVQTSNPDPETCEATISSNDSNYDTRYGPLSSSYIQVQAEENIQNIDFGLSLINSDIRGCAYRDRDGNGLQDDDPGIEGIELSLYTCNDELFQTITTDVNGQYEFNDIPIGQYYISSSVVDGYASFTGEESGFSIEEVDRTDCFELMPAEDMLIKLAYNPLGAIGDYVFWDENNDGLQDAGDWPIAGIVIELIDGSGNAIDSQTTGEDGQYLFDNIPSGDYCVLVSYPSMLYLPTVTNPDDDFELDSEGTATGNQSVKSDPINIYDGETELDHDFGFIKRTAMIDGQLVQDGNGDGILNNEAGIEGVTVSMYTCSASLIGTRVTDENGSFSFTGYVDDNYYLEYNTPDGMMLSTTGESMIDNSNGDGTTSCFYVPDETTINIIGAAIPFSRVGDMVWEDMNRNGLYDNGEPGLENIEVRLFNQSNEQIASMMTNASGNYMFEDLMPGEMYIEIEVDETLRLTMPNMGADEDLDSDAQLINGIAVSDRFTLINGNESLGVDFGFSRAVGNIEGFVWRDSNGDGLRAGELGLDANIVRLHDCEGNELQSMITNSEGYYIFPNLLEGDYLVSFDLIEGTLLGSQGESNITHTTVMGGSDCTFVEADQTIEINAGYQPLATIGDFIWEDVNRNGIQEADEPGLAEINIALFDREGNMLSMTSTNANGNYSFENILPGEYSLYVIPPDDSYQLSPSNATNVDEDSEGFYEDGIVITDLFVMYDGINQINHDFGFSKIAASVSGKIWRDSDGNDIDENEAGIDQVMVTLRNCDGVTISSTITNTEGRFVFENIEPGEFYILFENLEGFEFSIDGESNINNSMELGSSSCFELLNGDELQLKAGYKPLSLVGDFVWEDINMNGIQEADEPGIPGIDIALFDSHSVMLQLTTTDTEGRYFFENVEPGQYTIQVKNPAGGYMPTTATAGTEDEDSNGNSDGENTSSNIFTIFDGIENTSIDFGFIKEEEEFGIITGSLLRDRDGNGILSDEPGLAGFEISLKTCDGGVISTTTTDTSGEFEFQEVEDGNYYVTVQTQDGFSFQLNGESEFTDDLEMGGSTCFGLNSSENINLTLGMLPMARLGDFIWNDANRDGIQDFDEEGIAGIELSLFDSSNNLISTVQTNQNGRYFFDLLPPGDYYINVAIGSFKISPALGTLDSAMDSDFMLSTSNLARSIDFNIYNGVDEWTIDFGMYLEGNIIQGVVWEDLDGDGLYIIDEPGIEGITVSLFDSTSSGVGSTQTDENGRYTIPDLPAGDYYLIVGSSQGYSFTDAMVGTEDVSSFIDGSVAPGSTPNFTISNAGAQNLIINAGMFRALTVGDLVWLDQNENGLQDPNEPGIAGIEITATDENGNSKMTITDENGNYNFHWERPAKLTLRANAGPDYTLTMSNAGDDELDSDAIDDGTPMIGEFQFLSGTNRTDLDFGFTQEETTVMPNSVNGYVWLDENADGILENEEERVSDINIHLYNNDGLVESTMTMSDVSGGGYYTMSGFPNGNYYIVFELDGGAILSPQNVGTNIYTDSDAMNMNGTIRSAELSFNGESHLAINAGYRIPSQMGEASIGDFVWFDFNGNGIQDSDEMGANDIQINLFDGDGNLLSSQRSDNDPETNLPGYYRFNDLDPGTYFIGVQLDFGTSYTDANAGDDTVDSDIDNTNGPGTSDIINLSAGQTYDDLDIGLRISPGSVGNHVWIDNNGNGIQDDGEPGVNDVTVSLFSEVDVFLMSTVTTTGNTGKDGFYQLSNIPPGNYYVVFDLPEGYSATSPFKGGNSSRDSDVTGLITEGASNIFSVGSGIFVDDIDCGIFQPSVVGDFIWRDNNENGLQQFGEFGISDAEISLYKVGEGLVETLNTNANGGYNFENVRPGEYFLSVTMREGLQFTQQNVGAGDDKDSDADMTGVSEVFFVEQNTIYEDFDFGMIAASSLIGGRVWEEIDENGLQDFTESSVPGVDVVLLDENMNEVKSQTTNVMGRYAFANISAGDYYVEFKAPDGYMFTTPNITFNDNEDSDANENGITELISVESTTTIMNVDAGLILSNLISEPQEILTLTGEMNDDGRQLQWKDDSNAFGADYLLLRKSGNGEFELLTKIENNNNETIKYTDRELMVTENISYKVEKLLSDQIIAVSNVWSGYFVNDQEVKVFPSPASEALDVSFDLINDTNCEFEFYGMDGDLIKVETFENMSKGWNQITLPLDELKTGNYILKMSLGLQSHSEIITVIK